MFKNSLSTILIVLGIICFGTTTSGEKNDLYMNNYKHQSGAQKNSKPVKLNLMTNDNHNIPEKPNPLANTIDDKEKRISANDLDYDKNPSNMTREQYLKMSYYYLQMMEPDDINLDWRTKRKRLRKKKLTPKLVKNNEE